MPTLTLHLDHETKQFGFEPGHSLRHILDTIDVPVRSGCRGMGACGLCLVQIVAGQVDAPEINESIFLDEAQLAQGVRLACQVRPAQDLEIVILAPAAKSAWRFLDRTHPQPRRASAYSMNDGMPKIRQPLGVAVDLGTTHISLSMYDLVTGEWVAGRIGLNPQVSFGSDVMTRLVAAAESPAQAQALSQQIIDAICDALWDMAIREGLNLQHVARLVLVGNTAMLALLAGRNFDRLLQPSQWMNPIDCMPLDTSAWITAWGIHPQAKLEIIPALAGFVGSDLLAGVMATNLTNEAGSLLIDFGTNSEIALWDGAVLWGTSAAGGPAFEGSGLRCGLPAEAGAIYRVRAQGAALEYAVIGNGLARGICGSGLVDLIAHLVHSGTLTCTGRFAPAIPSEGFALGQDEPSIVLAKADVDVFQKAKSAIGVGIQVLLDQAGLAYNDLRRICIGGAFGYSLNVRNAQAIGLLPNLPAAQVELCGNTALAGCEDALLSPLVVEQMKCLADQTRILNLAQRADFDDLFLENLYLRPMQNK